MHCIICYAKKFIIVIALCNTGVIYISNDNENIILLIKYMTRDGLSESQIIEQLGITQSKYNSILKANKALKEELKHTKMLTDFAVEDSLLKKALGGRTTEIKQTDKGSGIETVTVTKDVPGDTTAIQTWLKSRCPERWSDKAEAGQNTEALLKRIFDSIDTQADDKAKNDYEEQEQL